MSTLLLSVSLLILHCLAASTTTAAFVSDNNNNNNNLLLPSFGVAAATSHLSPTPSTETTSTSTSTNTALAMSSSSSTTKAEIEVIENPSKEFLEKKGVFGWGTWGCGVSNFPWTYDQTESCYLLAGKVTVTPSDGRKPATFGKGDFVTFPAGMSCTWDVTEAVQKHFMFY